jgi:hypothetical protein
MVRVSRAESINTRINMAIDALQTNGVRVPNINRIGRTAYDQRGDRLNILKGPKFLRGELSKLCNAMRENNISYPWR